PSGFRLLQIIQQLDQTDRQAKSCQSSVYLAQRNVDVGNADYESNWALANFSDQRRRGHDQWFELTRHMFSLDLGKWNKAPIFLPGLIVNGSNPLSFIVDFLCVDRANCDFLFASAHLGNF